MVKYFICLSLYVMKKWIKSLFVVVGIVGIGLIAVLIWKRSNIDLDSMKKTYMSWTKPVNEGQPDRAENNIQTERKTYNADWTNFAIKYKSGFNITERQLQDRKLVRFMYVWPSQKNNTDLYDGIILTISQGSYNEYEDIKAFAEAEQNQVRQAGSITQSLEKTTFQSYDAYKYESETINKTQNILIDLWNSEFLSIGYGVFDPTGQWFQHILDEMLNSIDISTSSSIDDKNDSDWINFDGENIEFNYPEKIKLESADGVISLLHSIDYVHSDPCDFRGWADDLEKLVDFDVDIQYFDDESIEVIKQQESENIKENIQNDEMQTQKGFIETITIGDWSGYKIIQWVENCGEYRYYISKDDTTLMINKKMITLLRDDVMRQNTFENLTDSQKEEIISIDTADELFKNIIKSVKIK